jgi:tRNA threonylcarbamoyladenosine biosynthesis protein TsaE
VNTGAPERVISTNEEQTRAIGEQIGRALRRGDIVLLMGDLGSGKTCFAQGIARGLGVARPVSSPSFVLMNEYQGRERLFHVDLYRLGSMEELDDLGLWDYAERGVLVIEWPERGAELLPGDGLTVELAYGASESERTMRFRPRGDGGVAILSRAGLKT